MLRQYRGFTLLELMIAVAIIGILTVVAYPSYQAHTREARRTDGQSVLMSFANAMERHYTTNFTYLGAGTVGGNTGDPTIFATEAPLTGNTKYYDLDIQSASASGYTLRATPKNGQAGDGILEITNTGVRGWDRNGDNDTADAGEDSWED